MNHDKLVQIFAYPMAIKINKINDNTRSEA